MKKLLGLAASCLAAFGLQAATYYPITVNYAPETEVKDFPVLVRIPAASPIYDTAGDGGMNLRFTDELGVNEYPHEVDTWNASGESLVWVKIPELKSGFAFRLYCDGSATTAAKDVWAKYAGVWHLNEAKDSADKDYDPAAAEPTHTTKFYTEGDAASARTVSDGVLGKGLGSTAGKGAAFSSKVYDDRNGHKCPIQVTNPSKFTVSCWVRVQDVAGWTDLLGPVSSNGGQTGWKAEWTGVDSSKGMSLRMCQWGVNGDRLNYFSNIKALLSGWHKLDMIWDTNSLILYVDGELFGQKTNCPGEPTWYWTGWMGWGGCINSNGTLADTGKASGTDFDECRIYDGVKTAGRIAADYATIKQYNVEEQQDFLAIGEAQQEQEIPPGTVAEVGGKYFDNIEDAVAESKVAGYPIVLMANGLSWTFTAEGESIAVKLSGMKFETINDLGADFYIAEELDSSTSVTTFTLKKQIKVAAMRNVAVFKVLDTQDLPDLLPPTVKGLAADGSLAPGDYAVAWDTESVSKYGSFGVTIVSGEATVGGVKLPVKAYVRAALSYSDGYHNIAPEASSMTVIAPGKDGHEEITDVNKIMSGGNPAMITNGLPAAVVCGNWTIDPTSSFINHQSAEAGNPFLDVSFTWPEVKNVHRIEVVCQGGDNGSSLKSFELYSDGVLLSPTSTIENDSSRPKINNVFNRCFDFATPVAIDDLKVSLEQLEKTARGNPGRVNIQEILVWADGGPIDVAEPSTSAELVKLVTDKGPVKLEPDRTTYLSANATEITTALGEANVAVTVLPEKDGIIKIITMGEDGSSLTYKIKTKTGFTLYVR